jgi:hypothetical protein
MRSTGVPIPILDPPWPDALKIAVVTSNDARHGWRTLAHDVAAAVQHAGPSFPLAERPPNPGDTEHGSTAFLYRHADRVSGYLCLANALITGYRSPSAGYRDATDAERMISPCVMAVWVEIELRGRGVARQLVDAAAQHAGVAPSSLAWAEPFTDSGYRRPGRPGLLRRDHGNLAVPTTTCP